jgi:hypothetical protein
LGIQPTLTSISCDTLIIYYPYNTSIESFTNPRTTNFAIYKYCIIIPSAWHNMCTPHCDYDLYNYLFMRHDHWVYNRLSVYRNWLYDYSHTFNRHSNYPHIHCKLLTIQAPSHNVSTKTLMHIPPLNPLLPNPLISTLSSNNHSSLPSNTHYCYKNLALKLFSHSISLYTTKSINLYKHLFTSHHFLNNCDTININTNTIAIEAKVHTLFTKYSRSIMFIHTNNTVTYKYNNSMPLISHSFPQTHVFTTTTIPTTSTTATSTIPPTTSTWRRPKRHKRPNGPIQAIRDWIRPIPASFLSLKSPRKPKKPPYTLPYPSPAHIIIDDNQNNPTVLCNHDIFTVMHPPIMSDSFSHIVHPCVLLAKFMRHQSILRFIVVSTTAYSISFTLHYPHLRTKPVLSLLGLHHRLRYCSIDYSRNREGIG